MIVFFVVRE